MKQHNEYLSDHPEVRAILADFVSNCLVEQPTDVFEYAAQHFKGTATVVDEAEEAKKFGGADDDLAEEGGADDLDDLDDLDAMAGGSELNQYLRTVFESIDTDGSGSISKAELAQKLQDDNELQTLLEAAGGDGSWYVLEQLDQDGDGEVTWTEFEAMLGEGS